MVHGIPSVGNVDVCVGGSTALLTAVPFKGVAKVDGRSAGTYDLTVKAADATPCTGATAITLDGAAIPAGANISVVANIAGAHPTWPSTPTTSPRSPPAAGGWPSTTPPTPPPSTSW